MKIVHLCLGNYFAEGFSYQENMLTREHARMGLDVEVIASTQSFNEDGNVTYGERIGSYVNNDSVKVTRIPYLVNHSAVHKIKVFKGVYTSLEQSRPDILFIHNCQFVSISSVVKYLKKHPNVVVYVDNHGDVYNCATTWISKKILHGIIFRACAHTIDPYVKKFYGTQPARVSFLTDMYGIPSNRCELLVVGADDDLVIKSHNKNVRQHIREQYGIKDDDFLIVTGGKINNYRPETIDLMKAIKFIDKTNIKLLVFGTIAEDLKIEFHKLIQDRYIEYAGWIKSEETYDYFSAADLVVFPGLHSVMWEQAVAQGKPCIFRDLEGFHHVDIGGNADFVSDVSVQGLKAALLKVIDNPDHYQEMRKVAEEKGMKTFSYRDIARRSIEQ
ncbi:MAG: glycosyltransferase family 4 protein [Flavobacteriales bacterium]|nr:glycosyltransferase family 4 protein [Flavobacteriales bacterium]